MISNLINTDVFSIALLVIGIVAIILSIISIYLSYRTKKRYEEYVAILGKGEDIVTSLREFINDVEDVKMRNNEIVEYCNSLNNELINSGSNWPNVEYSTDGSNWTTWDYSAITLDNGNKLYLRGNNPNGFSLHPDDSSDEKPGNHFAMTGELSASGNIMSLIYGTDFEDKYVIPESATFCFYFLFGVFFYSTRMERITKRLIPRLVTFCNHLDYSFLESS